ncbi:MYCBP-associated protein [Lagopus leucura]|uniref:MYCBP-associated protein n=1 Tax=Lagopus leucura TaxID=30410 RepID=UPI001C67907C|nr:MYCBP-associated protein [Lagopus leucura]
MAPGRGMPAGRALRRREGRGKGRAASPSPSPSEPKERSPALPAEPRPALCPLRSGDVRALAVRLEDLEKLHAPRLPHDAGRIPVRRKFLVRKYQPREAKAAPRLLVARPAFPRTAREPLRFSGPPLFGEGCEEILPHHVLGSLQELKMEALARGNAQIADSIQVPHQHVAAAVLKEKHGGETKRKFHQTPASEHKALQNWHHNMAIRKKQERYLGEILQRPENELLMSISEDYRQIQEERDLIDRSLPALFPGKGYRAGSEFWSQPERIGDELTGLMVTLTRRERGCPQPVTHVGKPHTVQMETGVKPPQRIPFRLTWDKSLFLKQRRQELKSILEELDFYKPDLDGLEVIGEGRPFTSVSAQSLPCSTAFEDSETSSDSLKDRGSVVSEAVLGPSLDFCGQPARWINCIASCRHEVGIAARLTFETVVGEKAESFLTVSSDGTAAVCYEWRRLLQQIPSRETARMCVRRFYFDARPGVILPGETRKFFFLFKSERAGVFSESWEFRTHPLLLGGALLQVTLWGIAVCEDKLADLRGELEADLAAREGAAIVEETLKDLLVRIRTPERPPPPVGLCITEEELFHRKNPKLHYRHREVEQLHDLWRQRVAAPPALGEEVPAEPAEEAGAQRGGPEALPARRSATGGSGWKRALEATPSRVANVGQQEPGPPSWNFSLDDLQQVLKSIPQEEQREAALSQLNKAVLELCAEQRPTQSDLLYQTCLQLWREAVDALVGHSLKLRSQLGLPERDTDVDVLPEGRGEVKQPIEGGEDGKITRRREEKTSVGGKDKEDKRRTTKAAGKEKEEHPNSRKSKVKEKKKLKPSSSSEKEMAQPTGAAAAGTVTAPREQTDPIVWGLYQEKLYVQVSLAKVCTFPSAFCSLLINRPWAAAGELKRSVQLKN